MNACAQSARAYSVALIFPGINVPGRIWHLGVLQYSGEPVATTSSGLIPRSFLMSCCKNTPSAAEAQEQFPPDTDR